MILCCSQKNVVLAWINSLSNFVVYIFFAMTRYSLNTLIFSLFHHFSCLIQLECICLACSENSFQRVLNDHRWSSKTHFGVHFSALFSDFSTVSYTGAKIQFILPPLIRSILIPRSPAGQFHLGKFPFRNSPQAAKVCLILLQLQIPNVHSGQHLPKL